VGTRKLNFVFIWTRRVIVESGLRQIRAHRRPGRAGAARGRQGSPVCARKAELLEYALAKLAIEDDYAASLKSH